MQALQLSDIEQYQNLPDFLDQHWRGFADHPAYTNMGSTLSYADISVHARRFASYLQHCTDLLPGDRIGIQLPNLLQYPVVVYGAWQAGLVVVNLNPHGSDEDLRQRIQETDLRAIVVMSNCARQLNRLLPDFAIRHMIVTEPGDLHPWLRRQKINLANRYRHNKGLSHQLPHALSLRKALELGCRRRPSRCVMKLEQPALIQFTSGSRMSPRGVVLSHRNLIANALQIKQRLHGYLSEGRECCVSPLPMTHIYGFTFYCIVQPMLTAHTVLITYPRHIDDMVRVIRDFKFSCFTGLNSLFVALCQNPQFQQLDFSHLKLTVSGGMPLVQSVARHWKAITGKEIQQGYGLTEASPTVALTDPRSAKPGSVGTPLPLTEIRVIGEQGELLNPGESGELYVRGPQVMSGYWGFEESGVNADGWLATGDIVRACLDGTLKVIGRKQDVLNISGFPVYPQELENIISSHPDIMECAVVGLPDGASGQVIKLFVVSISRRLTVKQVRDYCRERLTAYKVPKLVEFCSSLPKSDVGKIQHQILLTEAMRKAQRQRRHI
ncbi:AMP-binding protein [Neptuniibacter sp. CAU 1671]|uniref:AMP-binding protein n=1 Tax=Neptuniibacter sp. CAU 1671 TaxID=3032593 RepID=UPI0023DC8AF1|nr:AMP-binding protein [Neptuniibacter sp. CAU 1671]MDF2181979.1 AMP-binding protein [Neptuniibacter sp. CAU 1671]